MSKSPNKRRPNNWFRFKQFTIRQERAAMKVGTDGVLLGAWATVPVPGSRVLDVGSGTGLIALMLAQRTPDVHVDALEIDPSSAEQALENFQASPWADRIACFQTSLQDYTPVSKFKYELIICNPPFFTSSFKTTSREKNLARHDDSLSLEDLLRCSTSLLTPTGTLSLVLPIEREAHFFDLVRKSGMFCRRLTRVIPTPGKAVKRLLLECTFQPGDCSEAELCIEEGGRHVYSEEYKRLTEQFYL